jgi:hypothetical protein
VGYFGQEFTEDKNWKIENSVTTLTAPRRFSIKTSGPPCFIFVTCTIAKLYRIKRATSCDNTAIIATTSIQVGGLTRAQVISSKSV